MAEQRVPNLQEMDKGSRTASLLTSIPATAPKRNTTCATKKTT